MKNFYIISPKVDGQSVSGYIEEMLDKHIVMMGWPEDEYYGRMFKDMSVGDYVVVGRGANWQKEVFFAGEIISDSYIHDGVQCRKLCNFVDLRGVKNLFSIENSGGESRNPHKAISRLKPESLPADTKVCEFIKCKIEMNKLYFVLVQILKNNYNLILTGAPGTGKTYLAKQIAAQMILGCEYDEKNEDHKKKMDEQFDFVQFHPSYDYTDFIEGLRPWQDEHWQDEHIGFKREDGVFMAFCRKALKAYNAVENKEDAPKYVFVIDEINRGELSKIFGELFFSIDPGYRGSDGKVKTQYANLWTSEKDKFDGGDKFYIPKNVYIIGTMNDIDRSVESMDFAMRRRFAFKEVLVAERFSMIEENSKLSNYAAMIKKRMENLNNCILTIQGLSTAYQIGASYFLKLENYLDNGQLTDSSWESLWDNHLKGLLFEYLRGFPNADSDLKKLEEAYNLRPKDASQETISDDSNNE